MNNRFFSRWRHLLIGLTAVAVICLGWWGYHWYTEAHRALARTGVLVVDTAKAKARQLAAVADISLLEVANSDLRASLAERDARIEALATAVVYVPEVVYVDRPGTQVEGQPPPPDVSGYWTAEFPEAVVGFRLPQAAFDLRLLPWSADVEIILDDQGVLGVASLSDRLEIHDVRGIRRVPEASEWALGVEGRYPWAVLGTVRWSWLRGEVGWDWSREALTCGLGIELAL